MPRKRAPGAGRKPAGPISGKLSNFSTRITKETRSALESEASATGQSISQVAERLIRAGLTSSRDRDPAMRALCFLIAQLAGHIVGPKLMEVEGSKSEIPLYCWRSSPFFYRAFKIAVGQLLDALEPRGPIRQYDRVITTNEAELDPSLKRYLESFKTPEARAEYSVDYILTAFRSVPHWTEAVREEQRKFVSDAENPTLTREFYAMPDAARDLAIKPKSQSGERVSLNVKVENVKRFSLGGRTKRWSLETGLRRNQSEGGAQ
jgi:hypothetical protein